MLFGVRVPLHSERNVPGNFCSLTVAPAACRRSQSLAAWVVLPERSRPSTTRKAPRFIEEVVGVQVCESSQGSPSG